MSSSNILNPTPVSLSSVQIKSSDHFEAILALGRKLADELGDEREVRTLSRWMAHYIAELIEEARTASLQDRDAKRAKVADAILNLWRHHAHFANGQRPFEEFESVMRTLESLDPDSPDSRYHQIWSAREPLNDEQKEVQKWLDAARGIDYSARSLMRLFLRYAAHNASDNAREWVTLAARAGLDHEPSVRVVRFILDGKPATTEEDEEALRREKGMNEIERLESFAQLASALAADLRQQLDDGSYVHASAILGARAEADDGIENQ